MTSIFPQGFDTFSTKIDYQTRIWADHVNKLQNCVENLQENIGLNSAGLQSNLTNRLAVSLDDYGNSVDYFYNKASRDLLPGEVVVLDTLNDTSITVSGGINNVDVVGVTTESSPQDSLVPIKTGGLIAARLIAETEDIEIGDWLTTSSHEGFATKVSGDSKSRFARSTVSLTMGSSGIFYINVGAINSTLVEHGHDENVVGDGGPLGDDVVDARVLDEADYYEMNGLSVTNNLTVSGDLIILGREIISQSETVSGNSVLAGNLEVYGSSYLGDQTIDRTYIYGNMYISDEDPLSVDSSFANIYFGKYTAGIWRNLRYNSVLDSLIWDANFSISGDFSTNNIYSSSIEMSGSLILNGVDVTNVFSSSGELSPEIITFTEISSGDVDTPDSGEFKLFVQDKQLLAKDSDGNLISYNPDENIGGCIKGVLGEKIDSGQPAYQSLVDGLWYKAKAVDGMVTMLSFCKVSGNIGETTLFSRYDVIDGLSGLPENSELYLSQDSPGTVTSSIPASGIIAFLGTTTGTTTINAGIALVAYDTLTTDSSGSIVGEPWNRVGNLVELSNPFDSVQIQNNLQVDGQINSPTTIDDDAVGEFDINLNTGNFHAITLTGAATANLLNALDGTTYILTIQNAVSGNTLDFVPELLWPSGAAYIPTTDENSKDLIYLHYLNGIYFARSLSNFS